MALERLLTVVHWLYISSTFSRNQEYRGEYTTGGKRGRYRGENWIRHQKPKQEKHE